MRTLNSPQPQHRRNGRVAGAIGFIGLVAPHVARMLAGEDQRYLMPLSGLLGALLLSAASIASKTAVAGTILPIGIITSFTGVPFDEQHGPLVTPLDAL